ncbi:hypothetical protein [Stenotrophomonas maltophilia]|uniref:hypothetical protein n=1 Tax=Stenotrophomonas maltophilia TaxID=40324 RepID=UPI0016617CA5|nr:hypothetical protein [Stenotrophomonas maltophilia]
MSNDNKTLADVQPGGMVRLGDQPPFIFARFVNGVRMAEGVTIEKERNLTDAMQVAAKVASKGPNGEIPVLVHVAALSAQPSPGGQVDGPMSRQQCIDLWMQTDEDHSTLFDHLFRYTKAALAARQPVGEPITVEAVATVRRNGDGDRYIDWLTEGGIAGLEVGDVLMVSDRAITDEDGSGEVYAVPPAQGVDLANVIEQIAQQWDGCSYDAVGETIDVGQAIRAAGKRLALIDSQAVGNG